MDCPTCGHGGAHVRESVRGRPYVVCEECGHQLFSRGDKSAALIRAKMRPVTALPAVAPPAQDTKPETKPEAKPAPSFWDGFFAS